jgi:CelD/BcsL family acetyltransferase involved in cellulose biosynthesis
MATELWPANADLIAEPGREGDVCGQIGSWISGAPRVLELRGLDEGSRLEGLLPTVMQRRTVEVAWFAELNGSADAYFAQRSRNFREKLRQAKRRSSEAGFEVLPVPGGDAERAIGEFRRLHEEQFGMDSGLLPSWSKLESALRAGVSQGKVRLYEMRNSDSETVAIELWLYVGSKAEYFNGGRASAAPPSAGKVLLAKGIEDACDAGFSELDLGGGYEHWKRQWAPDSRASVEVLAVHGLRARLVVEARSRLLALARRSARRRLQAVEAPGSAP